MTTTTDLRAGDIVRLRSLPEIVETLDEHGRTANLPFMREMLRLQGQPLRVESRADKTCDTINLSGCDRQMESTVHISGARCTGAAHGGCQAYCLLFFNEAWLEKVPSRAQSGEHQKKPDHGDGPGPVEDLQGELEERLDRFAHAGPDVYRCQATQLVEATEPLTGRGHYWNDLRTKNVPLSRFAKSMLYAAANKYQQLSHKHLPPSLQIHDGHRLPDVRGSVKDGQWPAAESLDLQEGDLVEVRSLEEIRATLDDEQKNRGLWFDEEMANLCGKRGRVLYKVERLIDEKSGRMLRIKKDLYVVSGMVGCLGVYHKLCTRGMIAMMRESWLRRAE